MRILDRVPLALLHLAFVASSAYAQADARSVVLSVRVEADGAPLADARIRAGSAGALTNTVGIAQLRLPVGPVTVTVLRLGYAPDSLRLVLAAGRDTLVTFTLTDVAASMSSVVITSARGATRIEETPLRVEALAGEDVAEKTEMRPADVTGFLSEMSGVRVQRTSAASGAAGVRLQGLRPRYTLLLTDGLPLNSATGSGLDILQLPPADLKQVEVVKGPATALYGPAALGGMINLVSKRPAHERDVLVQQSSERGTNAFGWYSERWSPSWGMTALVGGHEQSRRDLNADGWADMPGFSRVEVRPRIFFDGANGAGILITAGLTNETREGGFLPGQLAPERIRRGVGRETGRGARPAVRRRRSARSERRSGGSGTRLQVADGVPLRAGCLARHGSVRGHRQRSCGSALAFRSAGGPPRLGALHTAPRPHRARLLGVRGECSLAVCGGDQCRRGATDQRVRGRATGASRVRERRRHRHLRTIRDQLHALRHLHPGRRTE